MERRWTRLSGWAQLESCSGAPTSEQICSNLPSPEEHSSSAGPREIGQKAERPTDPFSVLIDEAP